MSTENSIDATKKTKIDALLEENYAFDKYIADLEEDIKLKTNKIGREE